LKVKKRGKHQSLTKEIKSQIEKIENLPEVRRVIIGSTINKRSSNRTSRQNRSADKMGSLKYQSDIDSGIKIRANSY